MDKMQEKLIDFIEEQKRENEMLKNLLYTIRNIAKWALIVKTDGILRPIKNTSRQEVYERMIHKHQNMYEHHHQVELENDQNLYNLNQKHSQIIQIE